MSDEELNKTSTMAKDYKNHICGECRNYVPRHSAVIPELLIGQMNEGYCKPYKNGPAACMCQREMVACSNFRKRKKSPTGKRMCVCRECQYNNPTPDGHFCALLKEYHSLARCASFREKDYDHDTTIPERFRKKWDEMNAL